MNSNIAIATLVPGRAAGRVETQADRIQPDRIAVLSQAQLARLGQRPAGLLVVDAAPFSHPVIRWCGQGIPVGLVGRADARRLRRGTDIFLDTLCGEAGPWRPEVPAPSWPLPRVSEAGRPWSTADGVPVEIRASVGSMDGAQRAVQVGASAIGLVRTEYLHPPEGQKPDAGFYLASFGQLLECARPLRAGFRLLDLAADKWPAWLATTSAERRAMRGLHGARLHGFEAVHAVVEAQLAALAALAEGAAFDLIWPSGEGLEAFAGIVARLRQRFPREVRIGAMLERPVDALACGRWLELADFVALGCNDLQQHLCGASRDDPRQRAQLDPCQPGLFRFYREVLETPGADAARIQLCGLLPQVDGLLPVLVGLGYRRFSVEPALIPALAASIRGLRYAACRRRASAVCSAASSDAVRGLLELEPGPGGLWNLARMPAECGAASRAEAG